MNGTYDLWLVVCSYLVAVLASYVALELAGRIVVSRGRTTWMWLIGGSAAMGLGIWSMHFVGMLAFHLPIPLAYNLSITLLSVVPAVLSAALVLAPVRWGNASGYRLGLGAVVLGGGIAGMHYTGMAAIPVVPAIRYDPLILTASVAIAIVVAFVALKLAFSLSASGSRSKKLAAALVMGGAVCAMHYTGMAAARFAPDSICAVSAGAMDPVWLAGIIGFNTVAVLLITVAIVFYDVKRAEQRGRLVEELQSANQALAERTRRAEQAEHAIQESEARFRNLTELSSDWYWEQDEHLRFTKMSGGVLKKLGWDPEFFIGKCRWDFPVIVADEALAAHKATLEAHTLFRDFVYARRNADGPLGYVSISGTPLFDDQANFRGYRGVGRDITEQKQAEGALRASERRLRLMVEHLPAGAAYLEGESLFLNSRVERITGYQQSELPTLDAWFAALYAGKSDEVRRLYQADKATGFPAPRVLPITRKDGAQRLLEFAAYGDDSGEVWLISDVTERVQAEAEVMRAREQLRLALVGSKLALFEWNVKTGEVFLSERWAEMIGERPGPTRTTMEALTRAVHPDDTDNVRLLIYNMIKGNTAFYEADHRVKTASGSYIWIQSHGKVVERDSEGRAIRVSGTNADITERKRAEQELREAHDKLGSGVRALEQRNREITLLAELSNLLLSCVTVEEACRAIPKFCEKLFPAERGTLFLMRNSRDQLVPSAAWGPAFAEVPAFAPDDCWALRRGRVHVVSDPARDPICKHVSVPSGAPAKPYLCLPLIIQGDLMGLLWIAFESGMQLSAEHGPQEYGRQQLAIALSDQIGLALSNIRLRDNLRQQTIRDPLTGLYNRRFLEESLTREMGRCKRTGTVFAVLMMDIDHFKRFNDTFGHDAGDGVLRGVAQALQKNTREGDIVCRFGGEEFVIVLPDTGQQGAATRAQRILEFMRDLHVSHNGKTLGSITASIGLAMYPQNGETAKDVIQSADKALYAAKGAGRDRLVVTE